MAIATMQQVLQTVLSQGNKEQNMAYPPNVYNDHFNLVTSFLVSEIAKLFPTSQSMIDIIRPYLQKKILPIRNGMIVFPSDYRHLLGAGIFVTDDFTSSCVPDELRQSSQSCSPGKQDHPIGCETENCVFENDPLQLTAAQQDQSLLEKQCISQSVRIVDIAEWDNLTTHSYKRPTLQKPIACIFEGAGLKICPYNVPQVELRYIRQPIRYRYGYKMNPDDTYSFDSTTTIESQWTDNALEYLVKGITKLYSVYTRDGELKNSLFELSQAGLF
jgi:hypothetical protein